MAAVFLVVFAAEAKVNQINLLRVFVAYDDIVQLEIIVNITELMKDVDSFD